MRNVRLITVTTILSVSLLISAGWIGYSLQKVAEVQGSVVPVTAKGLLTEEEAADYLNISFERFKGILAADSKAKENLGSYDTYKYISYLELNDGIKMFSKTQLDLWIEYNILNH